MEPFDLHVGHLVLSTPTPADTDRITALCQDPEIQAWTTVPAPYGRADAEAFLGQVVPQGWEQGSPTWAVRSDGTVLGLVGLDGVREGSAEIGYWLAPEARGQGVMSRALGAVLDAAFHTLALQRVEWRAFVGNWASWRVAWRHGFRKEGTVRGLGVQRGTRRDEWIGTLLREDARRPWAAWDGPPAPGPSVSGPSVSGPPVSGPSAPVSPSSTTDPEALVRQFHHAYGLPVADGAADVDRARVHMRMALVAEEATELVEAVYGLQAGREVQAAYARAVAADDGTRDTVAAADALGDLVYVLYGMALECGIPLPAVLEEIHAANLSKLGSDGKPVLRADGKVLKGPQYFPPDVAGVLDRGTTRHRPTAQ